MIPPEIIRTLQAADYRALNPSDQPLIDALTDEQQCARVLAGWQEITAERRARYLEQMRCVAPRTEPGEG